MSEHSTLGLGGHSFIAPLGNDPEPSFEEQCRIVGACLDNGIHLMDTTYYQERVALGKVMRRLGRRDEVCLTAWPFFKQAGQENDLVPNQPLEEQHLAIMLDELQTDFVDLLVIHCHDDQERLQRELALAQRWMSEGRVKSASLGMAEARHLRQLPAEHPVTHVLVPYNAFHRGAADTFATAKGMGLETVAMSPFIRGWKLQEIQADKTANAELVADILLRWVAFQPSVDHVVVSMRREEWVHKNTKALTRGPLTEREQALLSDWLR